MTNLRKLLGVAAVSVAVLMPFAAGARVVIGIDLTPPPDRVEVRPVSPWSNAVWINGHWAHRFGRWEWIPGHWARPEGRYTGWVPGHYDRHGEWIEGHWR